MRYCREVPGVASKDSTTTTKARSLARSCPRVPVLDTVPTASVVPFQVLVVVIGDWSNTFEFISNSSSVGLVSKPSLDVDHGSTRIGVEHLGFGEHLVVLDLLDGDGQPSLPGGWPENPSVARDSCKEGQGKPEKEHLGGI